MTRVIPLGDHPGPSTATGRVLALEDDAAVENQADLVTVADIEAASRAQLR
ncbi:MAG: hypothetical protein M3460_05825 [Actinomycetota bacterium]|nr:hypothetical protein [Actinomycetota bacterium]